MTDKAREIDIEHVIEDVAKETDDAVREYYGIFLNLIAEKNPEAFVEIRRESNMIYCGERSQSAANFVRKYKERHLL